MTAALRDLHWLPIAQRIEFKVLTLMHGAVHNSTPQVLSDLISAYTPARTLRSESQSLAVVPRIYLERYGRRAFSCAGPSLWNALPLNLRTQQDPASFRRDLKTYLFRSNFFFKYFHAFLVSACAATTIMLYSDTFYFFMMFLDFL